MTTSQFNNLKVGDWITIFGIIYKICEIGAFSIQAYHMLYFDDYLETGICRFTISTIKNCAEVYKPYEE